MARDRFVVALSMVALAAPAVAACNAILGIDSSTLEQKDATRDGSQSEKTDARDTGVDSGRDATLDAPRDVTLDAAHESGGDARMDVRPDASDARTDGARDAGFDAKGDAVDGSRDGDHDAERADALFDANVVCAPPDARPEGGKVPDPGYVDCNSTLTKDDGGVCRLEAGAFCCAPATIEGGVAGGTCERRDSSAEMACDTARSPLKCDEAADCPAGNNCCVYVNESSLLNPDPQFQQTCEPRHDAGAQCTAMPYGLITGAVQTCKTNAECGPCGQCQIFCCATRVQLETCTNPYPGPCEAGPCTPSYTNAFQDDSETDIDCGGRYRTDAAVNDASDQAPPCGSGHTCRIGRDCASGKCAPADGGVSRCE